MEVFGARSLWNKDPKALCLYPLNIQLRRMDLTTRATCRRLNGSTKNPPTITPRQLHRVISMRLVTTPTTPRNLLKHR